MEQQKLKLLQIRDIRKKEWFWTDKELFKGAAKLVGPLAAIVYVDLCSHTDNETQECWPSMETIAEETGIKSRNTVAKAIQKLAKFQMVRIEGSRDPDTRKRLNNRYFLISKSNWKTGVPEEVQKPKLHAPAHVAPKLGTTGAVILPKWLDADTWEKWARYRKEIKKKLTESTIKSQIKLLAAHQADHIEMIEVSIQNGWTGLFPLKKKRRQESDRPIGAYPISEKMRQEIEASRDISPEEIQLNKKKLSEIKSKLFQT